MTMAENDKLDLSLEEFESHIKATWQMSQKEKDFCDITFVCENEYIEAHKLIICSSSEVIKDIVKHITYPTLLVYLKGIKPKDMQNIISFVYQGEISIGTEDISSFMEVANDLKIKGLSKKTNELEDFIKNKDYSSSPIESEDCNAPTKNVPLEKIDDSKSGNLYNSALCETIEKRDLEKQSNDVQTNRKRHSKDILTQNISKENPNPTSTLSIYSCDKCTKHYTGLTTLKKHKQVVHEGFRFKCDQCNFTSKCDGYVKKHKNSVHMGVCYPCEKCEFIGSLKRDLKYHQQNRHKALNNAGMDKTFKKENLEKTYISDIIDGKTDYLSVKDSLTQNMNNEVLNNLALNNLDTDKTSKREDLEEAYISDTIDDKTDYLSSIKDSVIQNINNEKVVTDDALYSCDQCDKKYSSTFRLGKHVKVSHEGFRFTCDQCDFSSKDDGYVIKHKQSIHMGIQYPCDKCEFIGSLKRDLKYHVQNIHERGFYNCKMCIYIGFTKENLKLHMRKRHR